MVEYANGMLGSAFVQFSSKKKGKESIGDSEGMNLGDIAWNMRGVEGKWFIVKVHERGHSGCYVVDGVCGDDV